MWVQSPSVASTLIGLPVREEVSVIGACVGGSGDSETAQK